MSSIYNWPFAQNPNNAIPQFIPYDLIIQEPYPGVGFYPTLVGGTYSEIRVINGCLWIVTNALWNPNTLQWEQDTPCNPLFPASAVEICQDATYRRLLGGPMGAINLAISWETVLEIDAQGSHIVTPGALVAPGQIASQVNPTWNAGAGAVMVARSINVTDTSSSAESALDQLSVGGNVKWKIRKDGTLEIGNVPSSLLTGGIVQALVQGTGITITPNGGNSFTIGLAHGDYIDTTNDQLGGITGRKLFSAPMFFGTANSAIGGHPAIGMYVAYGATYNGTNWVANAGSALIVSLSNTAGVTVFFKNGLTIGNTFTPLPIWALDIVGDLTVYSNALIDGQLDVAGAAHLHANAQIDGTLALGGNAAVGSLVSMLNGLHQALALVSPSGSMSIVPSGSNIDLDVNFQNNITTAFTVSANLDGANGTVKVSTTNQILAAVAIISQDTNSINRFQVFLDQERSSFAGGVAYFQTLDPFSGTGAIVNGVGVYIIAVTNNAPHS